jgi:hypothetical protein
MDPSKLIPDKGVKRNLWVFIVILNKRKSLVLINFIMLLLFIHLIITHVLMITFTLHKLTLETLDHLIEVDTVRTENSKFAIFSRIKFGLLVVLRLAWHFGLWFNVKLLVGFKVIHRDSEIRDASNH